jgi:lipopolysaccharide export system ATP-binding protein
MPFCRAVLIQTKSSAEDLHVLLVRPPRSSSVRNAAARWLAAVFQSFFLRIYRLFRSSAKEAVVPAGYGDWNDEPRGAAISAQEDEPASWLQEDLSQQEHFNRQGTKGPKEQYSADSEGLLSVRHLRKIYKGRRVVEDVGLEVRRGEAIGLLGPNGAGKTTVFYMISGLVRPDVGAIEIDGQDVTILPMYRRARLGIGYLPQEASVFRGLSVEQNILAVLEITQPNRRERHAELEGLLEEFDLARLRKSPAIALSGGERRRCEIARSLAGHPSFILLDEPFAGVDPIAVGDIQNLVQHLKQRGIGVLITDHNVRETLGLIDRAYIIHSGRVLTEGTPAQIVADPEVRRLYLGEDFRM